jgi:hypothetical protein
MDAVAGHPGSRRVGRRTFPVERGCERWRPALQARGSCTNSPSQSRTSWRPRDYYARRNPERTMHRIIKQANAIGMTVRFDPIPAHPRAAPIFPSGVLRGWAVGGAARSGLPRADIQRPQRARRDRPTRETGYSTKDINGSPRAGSADERGRRYSEHHITALEFTEQSLRESTNLSVFSPLCRSRSPWRPPRPPA